MYIYFFISLHGLLIPYIPKVKLVQVSSKFVSY